jgi:tRNA-dihydrouridine synthase B
VNTNILIGAVALPNPVFLAPMSGVTDAPFRRMAASLGAGLVISEMTACAALAEGKRIARRRIASHGAGPHVVQLAGCEAHWMAEGARIAEALGAAIIDINMGCPAKKVCNRLAGSALLQDEDLVARILQKVARAVTAPVTLKTRTGWDPDHKNGLHIARIAEDSGIAALAIHGRTRADMYRGEAEHETVAAIKANVRIPVFANGDIASPQQARRILERTGCDGIMLGRAAQGRPWIFDEVNFFLATGEIRAVLALEKVRDIMRAHLEDLYAFYGDETGVRVARKHLSWYFRQHPGQQDLRDRLVRIETPEEQLSTLLQHYDTGVDRAA